MAARRTDVPSRRCLRDLGHHAGRCAACGPALVAPAAEQAGDRDPRFASLKRVSYGGSPMPEAVHHRASRVMGADFVQAYGITETSGLVTQQLPGDYRA